MKIIKSPKIDARNSLKKKLLLAGIALLLLSLISLTAQTGKRFFPKPNGREKPDHSRAFGLTLKKDNKKEACAASGFLPLKNHRIFPELFYGDKKSRINPVLSSRFEIVITH